VIHSFTQVFELLKTLRLPNFAIDQWQSSRRHYVAAHPEYTDITRWVGEETTDLTYHDVQGKFTKLLIDLGYLGGLWQHARPKYFLDVKTTLGPCDEPFFLSKPQYEHVRPSLAIFPYNHDLITGPVSVIIWSPPLTCSCRRGIATILETLCISSSESMKLAMAKSV
jgi:hypothetical protein